MKIVAITRTLNEERVIANHCRGYDWADLHLIADGGSSDKTIEIAMMFDNVKVRSFKKQKPLDNGSFMNPEPAHQNFLIDWAEDEGADWIVYDDADCWPNTTLHKEARYLFSAAAQRGYEGIMLYRLYMWQDERYFPKINVGQAIWAWQPKYLDARVDDSCDTFFEAVHKAPERDKCLVLDPPFVCLHYWNPEESAKRYAAWGKPQTPLQGGIYWPPEPLPEWAKETLWA